MITVIKIILLTFLIFAGFYLAMIAFMSTNPNVKNRLDKVKVVHDVKEEELKPFSERLVKPIYDRLFNFFTRFTPNNIQDEYSGLLKDAGMSKDYTPARLIINQILLTIIVGSLSFYLMTVFIGRVSFVPFVVLVLASFYIPIYFLRKKIKVRKDDIRKDLPNLLDMVYISVEAGLSFDAAMTMTASKKDSELNHEIIRAMGEINRGRVREDALYSISDRTGVDDVRSFIATIIQSEKLGSNIANVLRIQAEVIRDKGKQRAEERINKMPIKMLIPLVFLLLPALFVVIMGPALINILNTPF